MLSHIDDREVPCIADGCDNTWTWSAQEQIRAYGQPPPRRTCLECQQLADTEVACVVEPCRRTWTWTKEAQLKHRTWLQRSKGEVAPKGKRGKRRRADGPPRRKCEPCQAKSLELQERASVCKVHGCTREVVIDKDSQLRAWAALHTEDLSAEFALPKRMCEVCREFCRTHPDREVPCGRPGCERTWSYKTGAQLQAFLAGRLEDPIRLCAECAASDFQLPEAPGVDVEIMPCVVVGCEGTWLWHPNMKVPPAKDGDQPVERMCAEHRVVHGAPAERTDALEVPAHDVDAVDLEETSASVEEESYEEVVESSAPG